MILSPVLIKIQNSIKIIKKNTLKKFQFFFDLFELQKTKPFSPIIIKLTLHDISKIPSRQNEPDEENFQKPKKTAYRALGSGGPSAKRQ